MRNLIFLLFFFTFSGEESFSQISINQNDMVKPGDTFRISITNVSPVDPELTGENYKWDFSSLSWNTQRVDTFVPITSSNFLYQIVYNNPFDQAHKATVASYTGALLNLMVIQLKNLYSFYKNTSSSFVCLGRGAELSGIPTPVKYDNPEILYSFPMNIGNQDSSTSTWNISIPGIGSLYETINRKNFVDGWGNLKTPFGAFDVMRIKSIVNTIDSVYSDSLLHGGIKIPRTSTEYKWLAKGMGIPILQITKSGMTTTVNYRDSVRKKSSNSIHELNNQWYNISLYPNPVQQQLNISYSLIKNTYITFKIFDISGKELSTLVEQDQSMGEHIFFIKNIKEKFSNGVYLLQMKFDNNIISKRIIIN